MSLSQQFAKDKELRGPKSKKSVRSVSIPKALAEVLEEWRTLQADYLRMIAVEQTGSTPVVNNDLGENVDPDNYGRWFRNWCVQNGFGTYSNESETYYDSKGRKRTRKTGYKGHTPHILRHTQATLMIGDNVDLKTVQHRLGHASIDTTLNIYSHAIAANDQAAADAFADLIDSSSDTSGKVDDHL